MEGRNSNKNATTIVVNPYFCCWARRQRVCRASWGCASHWAPSTCRNKQGPKTVGDIKKKQCGMLSVNLRQLVLTCANLYQRVSTVSSGPPKHPSHQSKKVLAPTTIISPSTSEWSEKQTPFSDVQGSLWRQPWGPSVLYQWHRRGKAWL